MAKKLVCIVTARYFVSCILSFWIKKKKIHVTERLSPNFMFPHPPHPSTQSVPSPTSSLAGPEASATLSSLCHKLCSGGGLLAEAL